MRDLDIRGSGNLLGAEQSGFIAEIGFDMYHKILDEAIIELKDEEFKDLFKDEKPRPLISFTQIDTDLEVLIPDSYVTNITERYNLYTEISKLESDEQLAAFEKQLADRFGPVPRQVKELLKTLKLQWLGKEIGFEKVSLKKNTLKGYFVSNQQSPYFESTQFGNVLQFVKANGRRCNLREVKKALRLAVEDVRNLDDAIEVLEQAQVEIAPEFNGGQKDLSKYIASNLKYPAAARQNLS